MNMDETGGGTGRMGALLSRYRLVDGAYDGSLVPRAVDKGHAARRVWKDERCYCLLHVREPIRHHMDLRTLLK